MCGITGVFLKKPGQMDPAQLDLFIDELLLGIEHRGGHATGICAIPDGGRGTLLHKKDVTASLFIASRLPLPGNTRIVLGHTRFATQGRPEDNVNNHPVVYGTCFAVHNGHIANDDSIFRKHEISRLGEVDSEAIPALVSKYGFDNVEAALEELQGGMAIALADPVNSPDTVILAKGKTSPLIFLDHPHMLVWSSEMKAIKDAWGNVYGTPPRDKRFNMLSEGELLVANPEGTLFGDFKVSVPTYYDAGYARRLSESQGYYMGGSCGTSWSDDRETEGSSSHYGISSYKYEGIEWFKCSGCRDYFERDDFDFLGTVYALCKDCSVTNGRDAQRALNDGDTIVCYLCEEETEQVDGEILSGHFYCDNCIYQGTDPDDDVTGGQLVGYGDNVVRLPEPVSMETRRYLHLLDVVEAETGYPKDFVDHLLFRINLDALELDEKLFRLRGEFEDAYCLAEEVLNQFEQLGGNLTEYLDRYEARVEQLAVA